MKALNDCSNENSFSLCLDNFRLVAVMSISEGRVCSLQTHVFLPINWRLDWVSTYVMLIMLKVSKRYSSLCLHPRATRRHLSYGITQCYLPPDIGERAQPNCSQKGWYSINLPQRDGRLSWPRWLVYTPNVVVLPGDRSGEHYDADKSPVLRRVGSCRRQGQPAVRPQETDERREVILSDAWREAGERNPEHLRAWRRRGADSEGCRGLWWLGKMLWIVMLNATVFCMCVKKPDMFFMGNPSQNYGVGSHNVTYHPITEHTLTQPQYSIYLPV